MCCVLTALVFFGPRIAVLAMMFVVPNRITTAFGGFNYPWLVGILGLIFAPWTILAFVLVAPLDGFDWIWLGLGLGADIAGYLSSYHNRKQVPYYSGP